MISDVDPTRPTSGSLRELLDLVARLRGPDGCPWDREQTLPDLRAYLIEEAHEVAAAIDEGDWTELTEELGDLLFQIAFVLRLGEEAGATSHTAVVAGVRDKMIERHPHVFGDERLDSADAVRTAWEQRKARSSPRGILDGVPTSLPALVGAYRMSQKAAGVGFDWPHVDGVTDKVREELSEVQTEIDRETRDPQRLREELGDLLFAVANLARHLDVDPEGALAEANAKFRRRFGRVESGLADRGRSPATSDLDEMEALWQEAKTDDGD